MPNYDLGTKRKKISPYLLIAAIAVLLVLIAYLLGLLSGGGGKISGRKLRCVVSQDVTVFGDRVLYYDDSTLFCLSTAGSELWSVQVGSGARFHAGNRHVVVWTTNQLQILDRNGRSTYNDRLSETIQFARVCDKYVAIVTGDGVSPTLTIKDMDGGLVDTEVNNYADLMLLDCGFFGDSEYLWTTALDVYGAVPETTMHTYRVGQRLKQELFDLADVLVARTPVSEYPETLQKHAEWAQDILARHPELNGDTVHLILQDEVGHVFAQVLADAGVYKMDEAGRAGFVRFLASVQ